MKRCLIMIIFLITASAMSGCQTSQQQLQLSLLEQNWGKAFETARFSQTVNPTPATIDDVQGIEGEVSLLIMENYRQNFQTESSEVKNYNFEINESD